MVSNSRTCVYDFSSTYLAARLRTLSTVYSKAGFVKGVDVLVLLFAWKLSPVDFQTLFRDSDDVRDTFMCPELYKQEHLTSTYGVVREQAKKDSRWKRYLKEAKQSKRSDKRGRRYLSWFYRYALQRPDPGYLVLKASPTRTPRQNRYMCTKHFFTRLIAHRSASSQPA